MATSKLSDDGAIDGKSAAVHETFDATLERFGRTEGTLSSGTSPSTGLYEYSIRSTSGISSPNRTVFGASCRSFDAGSASASSRASSPERLSRGRYSA